MELIVKNLSNLNFETHNIQVVNKNEYQEILEKNEIHKNFKKEKKKVTDLVLFSFIKINQKNLMKKKKF